VGRLLEGLAGDGRLDRTVVVVLGDHGESLGEHREATHGFFVYDATVQIPLLMAGPAIAPRKVGDQVSLFGCHGRDERMSCRHARERAVGHLHLAFVKPVS